MKITVSKTSNFPTLKSETTDCIAQRTRSAKAKTSFFDPKTNAMIAVNFFKKIIGMDRSYPNILNINARRILVNIPTVEIWTGRIAIALAIYNVAKEHGL